MKKLFSTLAVVAFAAGAAQAQTAAARWFLSTDGLSNAADPQSAAVAPANLPTLTNPSVDGSAGTRLYLWVNNPVSSRVWNGFQDYQIQVRNGNAVITSVSIYNINMIVDLGDDGEPGGGDDVTSPRWAATSNGTGAGSQTVTGVTMFYVSGQVGVRNGSLPIGGDQHFTGATVNRATLVGHVELSGTSGDVFIRHGLASAATTAGAGITASNTFVRLGFGDEGTVYTAGASGDSPIAEATITPEPASLALLGLAALALRRR
ncbi:hypothetical protein RAS1_24200 [Phycisphaerae bacterium RAS1]|nr:hypothetical protein RAS1_24200 [Phycisphaerae bacterium RAS1]